MFSVFGNFGILLESLKNQFRIGIGPDDPSSCLLLKLFNKDEYR